MSSDTHFARDNFHIAIQFPRVYRGSSLRAPIPAPPPDLWRDRVGYNGAPLGVRPVRRLSDRRRVWGPHYPRHEQELLRSRIRAHRRKPRVGWANPAVAEMRSWLCRVEDEDGE